MTSDSNDLQAAVMTQLKAEIAAKGWKQLDVAKATGMQSSSLSRYLNGGRDIPFPVFADLTHALGLTIAELIERAQRRAEYKHEAG